MAKSQAVAVTRFSQAENLPAYIQADSNLGNEHVTSEDLQRPQIKLLQKMSPQTDSVEGAKPGMFINTLDNKLYNEILVLIAIISCNIRFSKTEIMGVKVSHLVHLLHRKKQLRI